MRLFERGQVRLSAMREESGFALTELLMVCLLLSLVLGATLVLLQKTAELAPEHVSRGTVVREGEVGLERMTRELRQASAFTSALSNSVEFDTFVRTGGSTAVKRRVRYDCSALTSCRRFEGPVGGSLSATGVVVEGVENATATACGSTGTAVFTYTPSATLPRYIDLTLALRILGRSDRVCLRDGTELRNVEGS